MRTRIMTGSLCLLAAAHATACGGDEEAPAPPAAPTQVAEVASEGFQSPLDAVVSPDGSQFHFTAYTVDEDPAAAVFTVPASGGAVTALASGAPLSLPSGLVMSCDGSHLVVADMGVRAEEDAAEASDGGALYTLSTSGGPLTALTADGIDTPTGLALGNDCATLYVTGWTAEGVPALFTLPLDGGTATVVYQGAPLLAPTGMYVDRSDVAWVLDHLASADGEGALFAIQPDGRIDAVLEGLALGAPGGCSLDSSGATAFVPTHAEGQPSRLTTVELASGTLLEIDTPEIEDPAGLRTARDAAVFALVDHEGNSIFRVQ